MGKRKTTTAALPMQPIHFAPDKVIRFRKNAIVDFLYEWSKSRGMGLNELALMPFAREDREQYYQLLGYSVSGYGDIENCDDEGYAERKKYVTKADRIADRLSQRTPAARGEA